MLQDDVIGVAESPPRLLADLAVAGHILTQHVTRRVLKPQREPVIGLTKEIDALVPCHHTGVGKIGEPELRMPLVSARFLTLPTRVNIMSDATVHRAGAKMP